MVRKLKYHEQKLLKKVDFINWEVDNNLHEVKVMKKFCVQKREDYTMYNKLSREIRDIVRRIKDLVCVATSRNFSNVTAGIVLAACSYVLIEAFMHLKLCSCCTKGGQC